MVTKLQVRVSVIIATKGRPGEARTLLAMLAHQSQPPNRVLLIGADDHDIPDVDHASFPFLYEAWRAQGPGLTRQRNEGIRRLVNSDGLDDADIVIFFDDDFRPAGDWVAECAALFRDPTVSGLTGQILADGIVGQPVTEEDATKFLRGDIPPRAHWASGAQKPVTSVYGCNMAFPGRVLKRCLFDEKLPLYGWQEDRDMTGQARELGRVIYSPECRGVHLGARGGRTSGIRFGYSQIANMIYLWRKGTVEFPIAARFVCAALASNTIRTFFKKPEVDHFGRFRGNMLALLDLIRGKCAPTRILDM